MTGGCEEPKDEIYRLWLQLIEKDARCKMLEDRLARFQHSRSWRLTSPLRAAFSLLQGALGQEESRPALQSASATGPAPHWQPLFAARAPWLPFVSGFGGEDNAPCCFVDVTELALQDLGAGVQRITRRWLSALLVSPPRGLKVEPVRLSAEGEYVHARRFLAQFLGVGAGALGEDHALSPKAGDVMLGLDFCRDRTSALDPALGKLKAAGVGVALVLPDMLPALHPEWFPAGIAPAFTRWLEVASRHADEIVCISRDSALQLEEHLCAQASGRVPRISVVPLGADLPPAVHGAVPPRSPGAIRLLMVGTVEPRKRYPQALDAFDELLRRGYLLDLLIVGRRGWESGALLHRLATHPQAGTRLHWMDDADDGVLASAYLDSDLLLMASSGEGYGLPIAEAGRLGCRLLLRDLPVFHEVAGSAASYFSGDDGPALADAISQWLDSPGTRSGPAPGCWPTWQHSAFSLKNETILSLSTTAASPHST